MGATLLRQSHLYYLQAHFKRLSDSCEQSELTVPVLFQVSLFPVLCPLRQWSECLSGFSPSSDYRDLTSSPGPLFCSTIHPLLCLRGSDVSSFTLLVAVGFVLEEGFKHTLIPPRKIWVLTSISLPDALIDVSCCVWKLQADSD